MATSRASLGNASPRVPATMDSSPPPIVICMIASGLGRPCKPVSQEVAPIRAPGTALRPSCRISTSSRAMFSACFIFAVQQIRKPAPAALDEALSCRSRQGGPLPCSKTPRPDSLAPIRPFTLPARPIVRNGCARDAVPHPGRPCVTAHADMTGRQQLAVRVQGGPCPCASCLVDRSDVPLRLVLGILTKPRISSHWMFRWRAWKTAVSASPCLARWTLLGNHANLGAWSEADRDGFVRRAAEIASRSRTLCDVQQPPCRGKRACPGQRPGTHHGRGHLVMRIRGVGIPRSDHGTRAAILTGRLAWPLHPPPGSFEPLRMYAERLAALSDSKVRAAGPDAHRQGRRACDRPRVVACARLRRRSRPRRGPRRRCLRESGPAT